MSKRNKKTAITTAPVAQTIPVAQAAIPGPHQPVTNITEAIAQQDEIVKTSSAAYVGKELNAELKVATKTETTTLTAAKKKGLARHHNLDRATAIAKAGLEVQGFSQDVLTIEGWHHRLCEKKAAEHAANSYACYLDTLLPHKLRHELLSMTLARCIDYGVTATQAGDLIRKAIDKRFARYGAETRYTDAMPAGHDNFGL